MKRKTIQEILEELKNQDKKVSPGDIIGDDFESWLKEQKNHGNKKDSNLRI